MENIDITKVQSYILNASTLGECMRCECYLKNDACKLIFLISRVIKKIYKVLKKSSLDKILQMTKETISIFVKLQIQDMHNFLISKSR